MSVLLDDRLVVPDRIFAQALDSARRSGVGQWAATRFHAELGSYKGGKSATFDFDALIFGLLLNASLGQQMFLRNVVRSLNALDNNQRRRAGLPKREALMFSERMVSRRWNALAGLLDVSPHSNANVTLRANIEQAMRLDIAELGCTHVLGDEYGEPGDAAFEAALTAQAQARWQAVLDARAASLRSVLDDILAASIPDAWPTSGCYAIDATGISSWSRQNRSWTDKTIATDPDAAWRAITSRKVAYGDKNQVTQFADKAWYGYWLHAVVRVPAMLPAHRLTATPSFIERIDLTSAGSDMALDADHLVTRMTADHEARALASGTDAPPRGDLLVDRAYSQGFETFLAPVRSLGYAPHFYLRTDQQTMKGQQSERVRGMLVIDGQLYSPAMPARLHAIPTPAYPSPMAVLDAWAVAVSEREQWRIHVRDDSARSGKVQLECPAANAIRALRCPLKKLSMDLPVERGNYPDRETVTARASAAPALHLRVERLAALHEPPCPGRRRVRAHEERRDPRRHARQHPRDGPGQDLADGRLRCCRRQPAHGPAAGRPGQDLRQPARRPGRRRCPPPQAARPASPHHAARSQAHRA